MSGGASRNELNYLLKNKRLYVGSSILVFDDESMITFIPR